MLSSVRARITLAATFVVAIALVLASWLVLNLVKQDLLATTQRAIEAELAATDFTDFQEALINIELEGRSLQLSAFAARNENESLLFGSVYEDGEVIADVVIDRNQSKVVELSDPYTLEMLDAPALASTLAKLDFGFLDVADIDGTGKQVLVGATANEQVAETLGYIRQALVLIVPFLIGLLSALVWVLVGKALKPVNAISQQVEAISTTSLEKRVPVPAGRDEIAGLARVMNSMLQRLEAGDRRQREFSADASHELRTPLTSVKIAAEMIERRSDNERNSKMARDIVEEADRMEDLITGLLELSRQEETSAKLAASATEFDMAELVSDVVEVQRVEANSDPVISWKEPSRVHSDYSFVGNRSDLSRVVTNLIENAKRHCDGQILVTLSPATPKSGFDFAITVEDDGAGVPTESRDKIFERFARLDEARSRDQGGFGIGLALVKSIVTAHGGSIGVDTSATLGGASFKVNL